MPSLLVQLEAFAAGRAHDRYLELSLKPATELTDADVDFILENFFHAQRERMIEVYPRYAELLSRRGGTLPTPADRRAAARRFSPDDLRDLQVWHKLAWLDPFYLEGDPRVRGLIAKGRHFDEEDKTLLREIELELLNKVIPEYRDAAARGQVELSTSPFYHPILPLLCDSGHLSADAPRRADAAAAVRASGGRGRAARARRRRATSGCSGSGPVGLWPSEGSVSDAMVPLVAAAGFTWMATDELILARTLGATFSTGRARPHRTAGAAVRGVHGASGRRERRLRLPRSHAVGPDRVHLRRMGGRSGRGRLRGAAGGGGPPLPRPDRRGRGDHPDHPRRRERLGALRGRRPAVPPRALRPALQPSRAPDGDDGGGVRAAAAELAGIFPGSWIDANFYIWIGHADDQRAWSQLAEAREALDTATVDPVALAAAREEVLVAEGSDWFWWYGDDHSSAHDLEFDDLFRRHLRNAYRLLQKPVPDELFVSNISTGGASAVQSAPTGLIGPTLDGEETSYFEWLGAGALEIREVAGAMHQTDRRAALLTLIQFGFDRDRLYVRLDGSRRIVDLLGDGHEFSLKFLQPTAPASWCGSWKAAGPVDLPSGTRPHGHGRRPGDGSRGNRPRGGGCRWPISGSVPGGDRLTFFVTVQDVTQAEVERHPTYRPAGGARRAVRGPELDGLNWRIESRMVLRRRRVIHDPVQRPVHTDFANLRIQMSC